MFSLSRVEFRTSAIEGRGVFATRRIEPGELVVAYAPKQRRLPADSDEAMEASATKQTLLSEGRFVIVPDTSVPGGWLCNHSCAPNAALHSDGEGRVVATRSIAPGEEVTIFYGWVSEGEPERDPCLCGAPTCRGFINFDLSPSDIDSIEIVDGGLATVDDALRERLASYAAFLRSIGQEQVQDAITAVVVRAKRRALAG